MRKSSEIWALRMVFLLVFLGAWQLGGMSSENFDFVAGRPTKIAQEFWQLVAGGELWKHFWVTGEEALVGFLIGTIGGSLLGLSFWFSKRLAEAWRPFVVVAGTFPVLAFAPLMIVWFGVGVKMKIALAAFSTVFVGFSQAYHGAQEVAGEYVDVLAAMHASRMQVFRKVIVPGSLGWSCVPRPMARLRRSGCSGAVSG